MPPEDLFAELEDVCPQSRPVHRRLRFPGCGDRSVSNSLRVPPYGGWDTTHCALQQLGTLHHRRSHCKDRQWVRPSFAELNAMLVTEPA